ncbi:cytochrome c [Motiliproteus sp. MSK22-1]|uniref:c-type cytochrome n=1 Tax=Motiliproteus sp. MSK22-1 TaxID=1897630 RepID=UPI000975FA81|nr:c-type cytochrome [Motiliproteus sp. MSK22-1]OMH28032.1 cytochrome C [Motiliproteus sp. MSK22-1]
MNKLLISLLVSLGLSGFAHAEADVAAGQAKAAACAACHGVDGNSLAPTFPKLAGQSASYIAKQLKDIKNGVRPSPVMLAFANIVGTDEDRANVGAFFASQALKPGAPADPALAEEGERIFTSGLADKGVAACVACHGVNGEGNDLAVFPQLQGQHAAYTETQLKAFRDGTRANDPSGMMRDIAAKLNDAEIKAVASYIQGLK